jgi:hypothetical protein
MVSTPLSMPVNEIALACTSFEGYQKDVDAQNPTRFDV